MGVLIVRMLLQENEIAKGYLEYSAPLSGLAGCDCPAHLHDKELPLELESQEENSNLGYSSHFDF